MSSDELHEMLCRVAECLRSARKDAGFTQPSAARLSGVGDKSISSYETAGRIESLKVCQLIRLLDAYNVTPVEFFMQVNRKSEPLRIKAGF